MADDDLRELNRAVMPLKFSLEDLQKKEIATQAATAGLALSQEAIPLPPDKTFEKSASLLKDGRLPVVKQDSTEYGLSFGRSEVGQSDDLHSYGRTAGAKKQHTTAGVYFSLKW